MEVVILMEGSPWVNAATRALEEAGFKVNWYDPFPTGLFNFQIGMGDVQDRIVLIPVHSAADERCLDLIRKVTACKGQVIALAIGESQTEDAMVAGARAHTPAVGRNFTDLIKEVKKLALQTESAS